MAKSHSGSRVRRRLSDTSVLARQLPSSGQAHESASVSVDVRRIDNGYVVRETRCGPGMSHQTRERFTEQKPTLPRFGSVFEEK